MKARPVCVGRVSYIRAISLLGLCAPPLGSRLGMGTASTVRRCQKGALEWLAIALARMQTRPKIGGERTRSPPRRSPCRP